MSKRISELSLLPKTGLIAWHLFVAWMCISAGSTALAQGIAPLKKTRASYNLDMQYYTALLKQNIEIADKRYSKEYILYDFIVDTEYGSTLIQNLIDPAAVAFIIEALEIDNLDENNKLLKIFDYVRQDYAFVPDPYTWPTVEETIKKKKGDCNSLSLLLMSLLQAADINTYAGISNGHMWVYAFCQENWQLLEIDQDPVRKKIYSLPGFYNNPVYKIFVDHSKKRKAITVPSPLSAGAADLNS